MTLNGLETKQLLEALLAAFPTKGRLAAFVLVELEVPLNRYVNDDAPLQDVVLDLITWAGNTERLQRLVAGAVKQRPDNKLLSDVAAVVERAAAREGTALPPNARTAPTGYRVIPGQDGYAFFCDRTPQWERVQAPAFEAASELVLVPGGFEQGHDYFLKRIRLRLAIDPRSVVEVGWPAAYVGPATRGEMLETLATALRRLDPQMPTGPFRRLPTSESADELAAEIVERIGTRLSERNLILVHGTLSMDFRDALVSYYTEWLPDILRQARKAGTPLRCLKCFQAVEWLSIPWLVRLRAAFAQPFSRNDLESGIGEVDARKLISAIVKGQAGDVLSVRSLPDLHDITEQDLVDLCESWALTDPDDQQRLVERCSAARTSSGKLRIVDAVLPYLLRRDVAAA